MKPPLPPGTVLAAFNAALARLEADHLRVDEDLIGLPLPEPLLGDQPGLVVSIFPLAGARPGVPGLVYPARALLRMSLGTTADIQVIYPLVPEGLRPEQPLGVPLRPAALPVAEDRRLRSQFTALLDRAAPAVAQKDHSDGALLVEVKAAWAVLVVPALAASYRMFSPRFHAWLDRTDP